jgi:hypothetical protein
MSFVLQSIDIVAVVSACRMFPNSLSTSPYCMPIIIAFVCSGMIQGCLSLYYICVHGAYCMLVCLNRLVTLCMSGLWYINVTHVFRCVFVKPLSVFCVLVILFIKLWMIHNGKPLFLAVVRIVSHPCCLA